MIKVEEIKDTSHLQDKIENITFTSLNLREPKTPGKNLEGKFKVPKTEFKIFDEYLELETQLPGLLKDDLELSIIGEQVQIKGTNKDNKYYTEIKLPNKIIPQSTIAKFVNGTLIIRAKKFDGKLEWNELEELQKIKDAQLETKNKLTAFQEQYHAVKTDYQNLLVKNKKEIEDKIDQFKIKLIDRVLKNIDNFDLALRSIENSKSKDSEKILHGLRLMLNELKAMIKEEGVEEIPTTGLLFDPNLHEVIDCLESDKHPENMILEELKKGYRYKNRVIRPSKVRVTIIPKKPVKGKEKK